MHCNSQTCVFTKDITSLEGHNKFVHATPKTNYQLVPRNLSLKPKTCFKSGSSRFTTFSMIGSPQTLLKGMRHSHESNHIYLKFLSLKAFLEHKHASMPLKQGSHFPLFAII